MSHSISYNTGHTCKIKYKYKQLHLIYFYSGSGKYTYNDAKIILLFKLLLNNLALVINLDPPHFYCYILLIHRFVNSIIQRHPMHILILVAKLIHILNKTISDLV